jgi:hypothetical protein
MEVKLNMTKGLQFGQKITWEGCDILQTCKIR